MRSNRSGKDPVLPLSPSTVSTSSVSPSTALPATHSNLGTRLTKHPKRSLHGILRLFRRRHSLAIALLMGAAPTAATVAVATTIATIHHMHAEKSAPLADAKPLAPPPQKFLNPPSRGDRHLLNPFTAKIFHTNPLRGVASWYGEVLHGHKTASGETFDEAEFTAAHRSLPFGTRVKVTDLHTLRSVIVRINDRGVLAPGRVIDLSSAAATRLGILRSGVARVKLEVIRHPSGDGTGSSDPT